MEPPDLVVVLLQYRDLVAALPLLLEVAGRVYTAVLAVDIACYKEGVDTCAEAEVTVAVVDMLLAVDAVVLLPTEGLLVELLWLLVEAGMAGLEDTEEGADTAEADTSKLKSPNSSNVWWLAQTKPGKQPQLVWFAVCFLRSSTKGPSCLRLWLDFGPVFVLRCLT